MAGVTGSGVPPRGPGGPTWSPGVAVPGSPGGPVQAARPKGPVRWGRVVVGGLLALFVALPAVVGGAILLAVQTEVSRRDPVATGRAPGTVTFDAGTDRYVIALSAEPDGVFDGQSRAERRQRERVTSAEASHARCTVTHPDGSTSEIRGDRQASGTSIEGTYQSVGEFTGTGGETTVDCRFDPAEDLIGNVTETPLMVHEVSGVLRYLAWGLLGGGLLVGLLATFLILRGTLLRKPRRA